jgi:hypothetical protein
LGADPSKPQVKKKTFAKHSNTLGPCKEKKSVTEEEQKYFVADFPGMLDPK